MYPDYQPRPDDVFHAVGYTSLDISEHAHLRLRGLSVRVKMENDMLLQQLASLTGKIEREYVEVLSVAPFPSDERPFRGPNNEAFVSIEYLSDVALRLCHEYGIQHPPVIEKIKRADIPSNHGITLLAIHYSRI
jgi:hypothetical protein